MEPQEKPAANPDKKKTHAFYVTEREAKKLKEVLDLMRKNEGKW